MKKKYFGIPLESEEILGLYGEELIVTCNRLRQFKKNKEKFSTTDANLPNYLWVASKHDSQISTCTDAFVEFLFSESIISFTGDVRYFEYKLPYVFPNSFFAELTRLHNVFLKIAGHHCYFKGVAFIDITGWLKYCEEPHFFEFLHYLSSKNDEVLAILYVNSTSEPDVENLKSALSIYMRIESISLKMPSPEKLQVFVEKQLTQQGFQLNDDAKTLIKHSIQEMVKGKHSRGLTTIKHFVDAILFDLLASNISTHEISAEMISDFNCGSEYVKRLQRIGQKSLGFNTSNQK